MILFLHFLLCFINLFDYLSTTTMLSWLLYFTISIEIKYVSTKTLFFLRLLFLHNIPCMLAQSLSHVQLFAMSWTVACQALLSMGIYRKECWSWLTILSPNILCMSVYILEKHPAAKRRRRRRKKKPFVILIGTEFNLQINLGRIDMLTALKYLIHEHSVLLYLCRSTWLLSEIVCHIQILHILCEIYHSQILCYLKKRIF